MMNLYYINDQKIISYKYTSFKNFYVGIYRKNIAQATCCSTLLCNTCYLNLKSYLGDLLFRVSQGGGHSTCFSIEASVPQGSVLGPVLYTVYATDLSTHPDDLLATFADDTCILASDPNLNTTSQTFSEPSFQHTELVRALAS